VIAPQEFEMPGIKKGLFAAVALAATANGAVVSEAFAYPMSAERRVRHNVPKDAKFLSHQWVEPKRIYPHAHHQRWTHELPQRTADKKRANAVFT
jgi:hypothetical protein